MRRVCILIIKRLNRADIGTNNGNLRSCIGPTLQQQWLSQIMILWRSWSHSLNKLPPFTFKTTIMPSSFNLYIILLPISSTSMIHFPSIFKPTNLFWFHTQKNKKENLFFYQWITKTEISFFIHKITFFITSRLIYLLM